MIHLFNCSLRLLVRTAPRQIQFDCSRALRKALIPVERKIYNKADDKHYTFIDKVSAKSGVSIYYGKKV